MTYNNIPRSLMKSFVQGKSGAFRQIYDLYHGRILAYSFKIAQSSEEAEEITQQVFIRLWEKHHYVDIDRPLDHYLYRITRNCAFNHLKQKAIRLQHQQKAIETYLTTAPAYTEDISFAECERLTHEVIDALPEKRQIIFNRFAVSVFRSPLNIDCFEKYTNCTTDCCAAHCLPGAGAGYF